MFCSRFLVAVCGQKIPQVRFETTEPQTTIAATCRRVIKPPSFTRLVDAVSECRDQSEVKAYTTNMIIDIILHAGSVVKNVTKEEEDIGHQC